MAKILEARTLVPASGARIAKPNQSLAPAAPAGLARSMNRAGLLLADCAFTFSTETLQLIRANRSRTAMYCATEPSTLAHHEIQQFYAEPSPAAYSRLLPPKWGLQCSIGLAASASTILLGIEGGVHTFNHPLWACSHALDQATLDLHDGVIDFALVAAVNSLEDPLMVQRWQQDYPGLEFKEGAAVLLLGRDTEVLPPLETSQPQGDFFGVAQPLIAYLQGRA